MDSQSNTEEKSFRDVGVCDTLCQTIESLGWKKPSSIQMECLKYAFEERDIIGLAETGSGKTGAFAIPIIQRLIDNPQRLFALVLTPTRELAFQISEQFEALGASVGLKTAVIVGGVDMVQQALALARKPHVIIATPGRLVDHLENTKVFVWPITYDHRASLSRILSSWYSMKPIECWEWILKKRSTKLLRYFRKNDEPICFRLL